MSADMQAETVSFTGPAAYWDPQDQGKFRALAGSQFLGVDADGNAIVLTEDGRQQTVWPGWLVMLPDGSGDGRALFSSPSRVRTVP
jgi:hypothetical protein